MSSSEIIDQVEILMPILKMEFEFLIEMQENFIKRTGAGPSNKSGYAK
jgi:hypothetical protein